MPDDLVPFNPSSNLEVFQGSFLVPYNWKTCGPVIHISGLPGLASAQPLALALTENDLSMCTQEGPIESIPLENIRDIRVEDLTGVSFPINTPSGIVDRVPQQAKGFTISFAISKMGTEIKTTIFTLTPNSAHEWVHEIQSARYRKSKETGKSSDLTKRQ